MSYSRISCMVLLGLVILTLGSVSCLNHSSERGYSNAASSNHNQADSINTAERAIETTLEPYEERLEGVVEQMPVFPGGEEALMNYLKKHIRYPKSAIADSVTGLVYTSFVVDENGKISDIRILRSADERFNEPTMEVLRNMPAWEPGLHRGEKVSVRYNLPVRYQLQNESGTEHSNE